MFASDDISQLPLFPLGTVLFPGLTLPLRVFEDRYRRLMDDLLGLPAEQPRRFGVVAIELGHEVGESSAHQLAAVGCVAMIHTLHRRDDDRFDLVAVGDTRFHVDEVVEPDTEVPYLRARVTPLSEEIGAGVEASAKRVARRLAGYLERLREIGVPVEFPEKLPTDPLALSYLVSGSMMLDLGDKQRLLEAGSAAARLDLAAGLLHRENRLLSGSLATLPAGQFMRREVNLN